MGDKSGSFPLDCRAPFHWRTTWFYLHRVIFLWRSIIGVKRCPRRSREGRHKIGCGRASNSKSFRDIFLRKTLRLSYLKCRLARWGSGCFCPHPSWIVSEFVAIWPSQDQDHCVQDSKEQFIFYSKRISNKIILWKVWNLKKGNDSPFLNDVFFIGVVVQSRQQGRRSALQPSEGRPEDAR